MNLLYSRLITTGLLVLLTLVLQGCSTSAYKTADMRNLMLQSQPVLALEEAEDLLSSNSDGVMENLNAGMLRQINGDYEGSNQAFEVAKQRIEKLYTSSVTEQTGSLLLNEETISFQGEPFEQILLHLYMAQNFLHLEKPDEARVELLQAQVRLSEWDEPEKEVPVMHYFSGMVFELLGENDAATVAYRKAVEAYRQVYKSAGQAVPVQLQHDLLRMLSKMGLKDELRQFQKDFGLKQYKPPSDRGMGELIVLVGNGLVPQKQQRVFFTWAPTLSLNVRIAVPDYPYPPKPLNTIRLTVGGQDQFLETVSDLDSLARTALAARMPAITARAIARAAIKKKTEKQVGDQHGALGQFALFIVNQGTEIADTRCWNTLPQSINLSRIQLPPGEYTMRLEVTGGAGYVVDSLVRKVTIKEGKPTILSERWIAPGSWNNTR